MKTAEKIRAIMDTVGLNQREFGNKIGISTSYMSKIMKHGYEPPEKIVTAILAVFGVSRTWWDSQLGSILMDELSAQKEVLRRAGYSDDVIDLLDLGKRASPERVKIAKDVLRG